MGHQPLLRGAEPTSAPTSAAWRSLLAFQATVTLRTSGSLGSRFSRFSLMDGGRRHWDQDQERALMQKLKDRLPV